MKEPGKIAAAIEIALAVRTALGNASEENRERGWDVQILVHELARTLALVLRSEDLAPSQVEQVVEFLRQVYAGVLPTRLPTPDEAVRQLCGGSDDKDGDETEQQPAILH